MKVRHLVWSLLVGATLCAQPSHSASPHTGIVVSQTGMPFEFPKPSVLGSMPYNSGANRAYSGTVPNTVLAQESGLNFAAEYLCLVPGHSSRQRQLTCRTRWCRTWDDLFVFAGYPYALRIASFSEFETLRGRSAFDTHGEGPCRPASGRDQEPCRSRWTCRCRSSGSAERTPCRPTESAQHTS
jgi:hypothetical protein